jgi:hypothetical protein
VCGQLFAAPFRNFNAADPSLDPVVKRDTFAKGFGLGFHCFTRCRILARAKVCGHFWVQPGRLQTIQVLDARDVAALLRTTFSSQS